MRPARRSYIALLLLALAGAALLPASAAATTTCTYNPGAEVLEVGMGSEGDATQLKVALTGEIQVRGGGPVLSCAGGTATLTNTEFVNVIDGSGNGSTQASIIDPASFASIGIILAMGGGTDELVLIGSPAGNHFVIGSGGVDSDGDGNVDVSFFGSEPERLFAGGYIGIDTITAQGSPATGAALNGVVLTIQGGDSGDTLEGSETGDRLEGGSGDDTLRGLGGDDGLIGDELPGGGNDTLEGGAGTDTLSFPLSLNGVSVDLAKTAAQPTGQGTDTISQIENVQGTSFDDTLRGDAGPNSLGGGPGDDTIDGRGGDDILEASIGTDTLTYAEAAAGVAVNLEAETASGGGGSDTVSNFENLIGSPFADTLTGSSAANTITPLRGADVVQALGGADNVNVRDGVADNASCGTGFDKATSDRRSLDTIQADCEQVDALPEAAGSGAARPGGGGAADRSLLFRLSGARRQRLLKTKAIVVTVNCPQEACTATVKASGMLPKPAPRGSGTLNRIKLKPVTKRLSGGRAKTLKLRLSRKQRDAVQAQLSAGEKPKLKVSASAIDAAGNVSRQTLIVTARP